LHRLRYPCPPKPYLDTDKFCRRFRALFIHNPLQRIQSITVKNTNTRGQAHTHRQPQQVFVVSLKVSKLISGQHRKP
jgi:hypothetical protein